MPEHPCKLRASHLEHTAGASSGLENQRVSAAAPQHPRSIEERFEPARGRFRDLLKLYAEPIPADILHRDSRRFQDR